MIQTLACKNYEFKTFWAKDFEKKYEKENYIELIKFFKSQFNKHPKSYIYHYADYEKRSLRQLASLYSSDYPEGYNFVDTLLREEKFIDLQLIINQSVRTSEKDMSLKSIEGVLYNFNRKGDVKRAEDSVRLYDFWSATKDAKTKNSHQHTVQRRWPESSVVGARSLASSARRLQAASVCVPDSS